MCANLRALRDAGLKPESEDTDLRVIEATLIASGAPLATIDRWTRVKARLSALSAPEVARDVRGSAYAPQQFPKATLVEEVTDGIRLWEEQCGCLVTSTPCRMQHPKTEGCEHTDRHYKTTIECSIHRIEREEGP